MLYKHPEAQVIQESCLQAAAAGDFESLQDQYQTAHEILGASTDAEGTLDADVQSAILYRNEGFSFVRRALTTGKADFLENAKSLLESSRDTLGDYIIGKRTAKVILDQPHNTPKKPRRETFSEFGATVSALGRLATVATEMAEPAEANIVASTLHDGQQNYGLAHDFLRLGTNGYYRVSNAMVGARQERINKRIPHTAVWLGRAAFGVAWTAALDRPNLKPAVRTVASRLPDLRTRKAAKASVWTKP